MSGLRGVLLSSLALAMLIGCGDGRPPPPPATIATSRFILCSASAVGVCDVGVDMTCECTTRHDEPEHVPDSLRALGRSACASQQFFAAPPGIDGGPVGDLDAQGARRCQEIYCSDCRSPRCRGCEATFLGWGEGPCGPPDRAPAWTFRCGSRPPSGGGGTRDGGVGDGGVIGSPPTFALRLLSFAWNGPAGSSESIPPDPVITSEIPDALSHEPVVAMRVIGERLLMLTSGSASAQPQVAGVAFERSSGGAFEGVVDYGPFALPIGAGLVVTSAQFFAPPPPAVSPWVLVGTNGGVFLFELAIDGPRLDQGPEGPGLGMGVIVDVTSSPLSALRDPRSTPMWAGFVTSNTTMPFARVNVTEGLGTYTPTFAQLDLSPTSIAVDDVYPPELWGAGVPTAVSPEAIESFVYGPGGTPTSPALHFLESVPESSFVLGVAGPEHSTEVLAPQLIALVRRGRSTEVLEFEDGSLGAPPSRVTLLGAPLLRSRGLQAAAIGGDLYAFVLTTTTLAVVHPPTRAGSSLRAVARDLPSDPALSPDPSVPATVIPLAFALGLEPGELPDAPPEVASSEALLHVLVSVSAP